jgi:hypothetical protein
VSAAEMKLISHKYKNSTTNEMFGHSQPRWEKLMAKVNKLNVKRPLTVHQSGCGKKLKYKLAVLKTQSPRNDPVVRRYELGTRIFRARFPLKPPTKDDL